MAIRYKVDTFPIAKQGSLLASSYGEHMVSLDITEETPNGYICKVGKMKSLDLFEVEEAGTFKGYIALKGADGMYLVVVEETDPLNAVIIQQPLIKEESPRRLTLEKNFYNDPADGAARGYQLHPIDRIWYSADSFVGTPVVGATISGVQGGKPVIATA